MSRAKRRRKARAAKKRRTGHVIRVRAQLRPDLLDFTSALVSAMLIDPMPVAAEPEPDLGALEMRPVQTPNGVVYVLDD